MGSKVAREFTQMLARIRAEMLAHLNSHGYPRWDEATQTTTIQHGNSHPWDINNGNCPFFADKVVEAFPDAERMDDPQFFHTWVKWRGKHYDAESIEGVARKQDLMHYRRIRKSGMDDQGNPPDYVIAYRTGQPFESKSLIPRMKALRESMKLRVK